MRLTNCTTCGTLEELLSDIDCTIVYNAVKKYNSIAYNLGVCLNSRLLRDLLRYKRILNNRLYDATYPCSSISVDKIITQASFIVREEDCSRCKECDIDVLPSTTSTTSTTTTSTTTSTTTTSYPVYCSRYRVAGNPQAPFDADYNLTYLPCGIDRPNPITIVINSQETIDLCCVPDTISVDNYFTVTLLNEICIP